MTQSGKDGDNAIGFSTAKKQAASLTQTVTGLEKGTYVLTAWVKSSGGQNDAAMLLKGYDQVLHALYATMVWPNRQKR